MTLERLSDAFGRLLAALAVLGCVLLSQLLGLVSHVPAGLGVFETSMVLLLAPWLPGDRVLGSLLAYRLVYYLLPMAVALPLFIVPLTVQWWSTWYPGSEPGGGSYVAQRMLAARTERDAMAGTLLFNVAHYALRPWPWIVVALASAPQLALKPRPRRAKACQIRSWFSPPVRIVSAWRIASRASTNVGLAGWSFSASMTSFSARMLPAAPGA